MKTETTATKEMPQTSFEKEHNITAGAPMTRNEVSQETPEQTQERINRDIEFGRRAPEPASVDMEKTKVTGEQVAAVEETAFKPTRSTAAANPETGEDPGKEGGKSSGHPSGPPQNQTEPQKPQRQVSDETDDDDLEAHTVEELKTIAHREGAEVRHDMVKADIIKSIKKNRKKG